MNILVTGGSGFIGSHVCDALLARGHNVRVYSRHHERHRAPLPGVEYILGDIEDSFHLSEALNGIECIVHLVSNALPGTSNLNPVADIESNLISTVKLMELMRKSGPKRIVFLSSGGTVYGEPDHSPVSETAPLNPLCSYGVIKLATENYLRMYEKLYGLAPVILRVSNAYGPRQGHIRVQGVVATFLNRLQSGEPLAIWGDGEAVRDYLYVSDLAELCAKAVESQQTGTFNVGSGVGTSIKQLVDLIRQVTQTDPMVTYEKDRIFDVSKIYLDSQMVRRTFDWQPEVGLEEGIRRHWNWLQGE